LKVLHDAVRQFRLDADQYPSEDMGLLDLVEQPMDLPPGTWPEGGYLETTDLPKDGWGNEFYYQRYPESGKEFVIISFGPDREEGTEDDLYSTDAT
ncbi:MAG: type II secretion system protein GspG, partial [Planctomycetota bacterium]